MDVVNLELCHAILIRRTKSRHKNIMQYIMRTLFPIMIYFSHSSNIKRLINTYTHEINHLIVVVYLIRYLFSTWDTQLNGFELEKASHFHSIQLILGKEREKNWVNLFESNRFLPSVCVRVFNNALQQNMFT